VQPIKNNTGVWINGVPLSKTFASAQMVWITVFDPANDKRAVIWGVISTGTRGNGTHDKVA
jgi:hypothetical protein